MQIKHHAEGPTKTSTIDHQAVSQAEPTAQRPRDMIPHKRDRMQLVTPTMSV
jgi:hypothetical protein